MLYLVIIKIIYFNFSPTFLPNFRSLIKIPIMKSINLLLLLIVIFYTVPSQAQIITACAGNYTAGYMGDGGPATAAELHDVFDIKLDAAGNLFICDNTNNVVRKVNTSGIITTFAGTGIAGYSGDGGPATSAQLNGPGCLAIDNSGNVYIGDMMNSVVRKVSTSGIISTFAGHYGGGIIGDGGAATATTLAGWTSGIAVDPAGNVYISASDIRKVNTSGIISTFAGNGTVGYSGDGGPATAAQLLSPSGIVLTGGNLYFCDKQNNALRKINLSTNIITTVAGTGVSGYIGDGGPATAAELSSPIQIATDGSNIFFADWASSVIRKFNISSGIINTVAGGGIVIGDGGPALGAQLHYAAGIALDGIGRMYISDQINNVVRLVDTTTDHFPVFTTTLPVTLTVCDNAPAINIDTLLKITDPDLGQTETWNYVSTYTGVLGGFSTSMLSTGGVLIPLGLTYTPAAGYSGLDSFVVSISDGIGLSKIMVHITVNPLPTPVITVAGSLLSTSSAFTSYQWYLSATAIPGATNSTYTALSNGSYTVKVTDDNGCSATSPAVVVSHVSIEQLNSLKNNINIYPNPIHDQLTVMSGYNIMDVIISNLLGQVVYSHTYDNEIVQVDLSGLPPDIYVARINGIHIRKIVKE